MTMLDPFVDDCPHQNSPGVAHALRQLGRPGWPHCSDPACRWINCICGATVNLATGKFYMRSRSDEGAKR